MRKIVIFILSVLLLASAGVAVAAGAQSFASAAENDAAETVTESSIIEAGNTYYSGDVLGGGWYIRLTVAFDLPEPDTAITGIESRVYGGGNAILYDYLILNGQKGQVINQHMNIYKNMWGGHNLVEGKRELTVDVIASQLAMDGTDTLVFKKGMPLVWDLTTGEVSCVLDKDYTFRYYIYDARETEPIHWGKWGTEDLASPDLYWIGTGATNELILNFDMDRLTNMPPTPPNTIYGYDKIESAQMYSETFRNAILLNGEPIPSGLYVHYNVFDTYAMGKVELYIWTSTGSEGGIYAPTDGTTVTLKKGLYVMNGRLLGEDLNFEFDGTFNCWVQVKDIKLRSETSYETINDVSGFNILYLFFDARSADQLTSLTGSYEQIKNGILLNGQPLTDNPDYVHMNFTASPEHSFVWDGTQLCIYFGITDGNESRLNADTTLTLVKGTEFPFGKLGYDITFRFVPGTNGVADGQWELEFEVGEVITDGYSDDFVFEYGQQDAEIAIDKLNVVYTNGFTGELPVTWNNSAVDTSQVGTGSATGTLTGAEFADGVSDEVTIPYTVNKKTLTVTPDAQTITYGDDIAQTAYTITGFINGENADNVTITGTPVLTASSDQVSAQNKTIALSVDGMSADNYVFVAGQSAALTINKRAITVKADDVTIEVGEELPLFTYQITSGTLAEGDELSSISIYTDTDATSDSPAGTYTISLTGVSENYDIIFEIGVLTIEGSGGGDDGETGGCASALVPGVSVIGAAVLFGGAVLMLRKKRSNKN